MDSRTWTLALNSLLLAAGVCAVSLPLGSVLAWLLARTDLPGRRAAMGVLGLTLFVPLYLQAAGWQAGFGYQGCYTLALGTAAWIDGWTGAIWVHAMAALPWVVLIVGLGLRLVEPELEEQALLDGSRAQVFWHVTLRAALPAVTVAALWVAIVTAGEMTVTDLFVVRTYAEELYTRFTVGPEVNDTPMGFLPGTVLTAALAMGALLVCARLAPGDRPVRLRRGLVFPLGPWRRPAAILVLLLLVFLVGVPLVNLGYKAGVLVAQTESDLGMVRQRSWSPTKCMAVVAASPWRYRREFGWSLAIGSLAATAAVLTAIPLAWLARRGRHRSLPVLTIAALCLAMPGPMVGLLVIRLLNRPEVPALAWLYDHSILAPWLALWIRCLPLPALILWHAVRTFPRATLEAAAVDGAGRLRQLLWIILPCRLPAAALAWVVAFAVALGDLAASLLVAPPGVRTLSMHIFDLLHSSVEDQVAGISLALVLVFAGMTGLAAWLVWTAGRASDLDHAPARGV